MKGSTETYSHEQHGEGDGDCDSDQAEDRALAESRKLTLGQLLRGHLEAGPAFVRRSAARM